MKLADNEKSKKLLKLLEQKRKVEVRRRKITEQIRVEEDKIRSKLGRMTRIGKKNYQQMKKAYQMRQDGATFIEIGKILGLTASQVSKLCQIYSDFLEVLDKKNNE